MSNTVQTMEYVYSPPLPDRIAAPRGFFVGMPITAATSTQTLPETIGTVTRTPLDSSILEQQMRMFMVERRAGTAYASSSSASLPLPASDTPAPPQTAKPLPPPGGLRRGVPMVQKGSSPPAARLGRRGASPPIKGAAEKGQSHPVSREQSPNPAPRKLAVVETVIPQRSLSLENVSQGRQRSNTDVALHPHYDKIPTSPSPAPVDFRPQVPEKDFVRSVVAADHTRSRSLSPSAHGKEKPERRKNVFGLFPSEKKEKDENNKRGMADHIAAVFLRKVSNQSAPQQGDPPATSFKPTPTPQTAAKYNSRPIGFPPPQPWITSATTPPVSQFGWHQRNNSSSATSTSSTNSKLRQIPHTQHSRDNSSSTNASASHFRNPSGLAKQASFDMEEAMEKIWGPIEGTHHSRPVQRGSPSTIPELKQRPTRSQTSQKPFSNGEYPKPSPLLPPVNKEAYQKRTLPPSPLPAPAPAVELYAPPVEHKPMVEQEESPVSPLLPIAYNPYEPDSPASSVLEPLLPIAMIPPSPRRLSSRVPHCLSVSIPISRPITQRFSAPGTPRELFKATSASHENMYFLELPTGLGEFHLDNAMDVQQEDEDDILIWLDSLKFEDEQGKNVGENEMAEGEHYTPDSQDQPPQVVIDAPSPAMEVAPATPIEVEVNATRPRSPSFIPRKPVGSAKATAAATAPPTPPNPNLLSPPATHPSPPSPSDYSGTFSGRISFASSIDDVFKCDLRYSDELPPFDWRSSGELSDYGAGGLRLQNVPAAPNGTATSSVTSSPQTQPSTTFSSPNLSEYSVSSTGTPSSGGLCTSDIDAILGSGPSKLSTTTHVYIPDVDDSGSEGMRSSEIEAILRAQMVADEEEMERRRSRAEKEREEILDREYLERRRTRYVRGRNSGLEGDILFVLRGEDIIEDGSSHQKFPFWLPIYRLALVSTAFIYIVH
ncbi:hypothetical protein EV426DRAFT_18140 [Tirmania nivea]|nr:hypothetical protein EV426DRAFT_18140 [Tirmania nivea]